MKQILTFPVMVLLVVMYSSCNSTIDKKQQQTENNIKRKNTKGSVITNEIQEIHVEIVHPKFKVTEYCDAEDQDSVMFYFGKFGSKTAFHILVRQEDNQLKVTYRIIDDCCLKFRGKASMDSTKLNLFHLKRLGNPCECFCIYEFEFLIRNIGEHDKLFINKVEVEI